jgi:hypothetical protein
MANPTTYFGWVMPNSADLVTDLPADFNVFGQGVDTSMQYLLGGTTGQVLSKTSGTNMAFTWINNDTGDITGVTAGTGITGGGTSGTVTVTNDMATTITTAGDLIKGTGSGTYNRLGIGSTSQVLTVVSGAPAWATPASGGSMTLLSTTAITAVASITLSSISGSYKHLYILVEALNEVSGGNQNLRINGNTGSAYRYNRTRSDTATASVDNASTSFPMSFSGAPDMTISCYIYNYASGASVKALNANYSGTYSAANSVGGYISATAVTSITITWGGVPTAGGNVYLYGVN